MLFCAAYTKSVIIDVYYIDRLARLASNYVEVGTEVLIFRSDVPTLQYIDSILFSRYFLLFLLRF